MTREEIERTIENGESVWLIFDNRVYRIDKSKIIDLNDCYIAYYNDVYNCKLYADTSDFYKTEAKAKHHVKHYGIIRTEKLPFLTWEEFDKGNRLIRFIGKNGEKCKLEGYQKDDKQSGFIDVVVNGTGSNIDYDYTEANFYKAYDECVRLFKGDE